MKISTLFKITTLLLCLQTANIYSQDEGLKFIHFVSQGEEIDMAYAYRKSETPNGKTVVLLHGKNFSHRYWHTTIMALTEDGYNVLAPDQVGFGSTTKPIYYQHSFQQCAVNTKALLDSLGLSKVILVGHSMGGMIATRFALMYPEICTKLILENPIGLEDWKLKVAYSTVDEEFKKEKEKTRESLKDYFTKNYFHNEWREDYDELLDETAAFLKAPDFPIYAKSMALTSDMIFTQPVCYEFKHLKIPTVLIIGQEDRTAIGKDKADKQTALTLGNYPALGKQTASQIPNCKLIELKGLGHIPHVEDFKKFIHSLNSVLIN